MPRKTKEKKKDKTIHIKGYNKEDGTHVKGYKKHIKK